MWKEIQLTPSTDTDEWLTCINRVLKTDVGRNYFMILGMREAYEVYERLWVYEENLSGVLALRKSQNAQLFLSKNHEFSDKALKELAEICESIPYKELITTLGMVGGLRAYGNLGEAHPRSYIGELHHLSDLVLPVEAQLPPGWLVRDLTAMDTSQIEILHKHAFDHPAPSRIIEKRLGEGYGRGIGLFDENDLLVAVVMSECETAESANVVGVSTLEAYRGKGYASLLTHRLSEVLLREGKRPHLMFDNLSAGRIYESLGYQIYDQTVHFKK